MLFFLCFRPTIKFQGGSSADLASQAASYRMAEIQKWEKIGQKIENGPRPEMGNKRPKNGEKIEKWPQIPCFRHFWAIIFFPISGRGPFSFFGQCFFPSLDFGPFSILCQAGLTRNADPLFEPPADPPFRGFAKGWFPKGWFWRMFPRNENRNEGTFAKTTLLETALLSPSDPLWC